ncbi:MAG TPA: hypothetical protein ENH55_05680 [Aurantimonas coralicida]|nr:hypothetical protein [Aurantimonas coralicida]HEU01263.1 hypothetical protein [Aurantimonas coralicida]
MTTPADLDDRAGDFFAGSAPLLARFIHAYARIYDVPELLPLAREIATGDGHRPKPAPKPEPVVETEPAPVIVCEPPADGDYLAAFLQLLMDEPDEPPLTAAGGGCDPVIGRGR